MHILSNYVALLRRLQNLIVIYFFLVFFDMYHGSGRLYIYTTDPRDMGCASRRGRKRETGMKKPGPPQKQELPSIKQLDSVSITVFFEPSWSESPWIRLCSPSASFCSLYFFGILLIEMAQLKQLKSKPMGSNSGCNCKSQTESISGKQPHSKRWPGNEAK